MPIRIDNSTPFGAYAPNYIRRQFHAVMNETYKAGWLGRRTFGRLRSLERLLWSDNAGIVDVERFGLRWRLYQQGNVSDSRLLLRPDNFEPTEVASIVDLVTPHFTFIDIGANCGFYSLRVAHAVARFGTGRIVAIEPHPKLRQRLAFNVKLNRASEILILSCAIGDRNGAGRLLEREGNLGETHVSEQGSIEVTLRTLLDVVEVEKLDRIDAIKVDVEGFEDRVLDPFLRDAPDFVLPRVIVAEHHWSRNWQSDWLSRAGGRGYRENTRTRLGNLILERP